MSRLVCRLPKAPSLLAPYTFHAPLRDRRGLNNASNTRLSTSVKMRDLAHVSETSCRGGIKFGLNVKELRLFELEEAKYLALPVLEVAFVSTRWLLLANSPTAS